MNYKKPYHYMFNKYTDLIEEIKLIQQEAEEMYLQLNEDYQAKEQKTTTNQTINYETNNIKKKY